MNSDSTKRTSNLLAIVLWAVSRRAGLLYGVTQTVIKASALFTA